jgi:uncharacterized protein DUF6308
VRPVVLRRGLEVSNPLEVASEFLERYARYEGYRDARPMSFDEDDLRLANRGGARISAAEISEILARRPRIERSLRSIPAEASLTDATIPWTSLSRLYDAFADIRGVGLSKMTKTLHKKRPGLIPMLDSVVQAYLPSGESGATFGERAILLTRAYKEDLDRNRAVLRELERSLAARGQMATEVRLLDLMIWSVLS